MKAIHLPRDLGLASDQLHIWKLNFATFGDDFDVLHEMLSSDEQRTMNAFYTWEGKAQFGLTRAFLRALLAHYTNHCARELVFEKGEFGKPFLRDAYACENAV